MATNPTTKTEALYQKNAQLHTHTSPISSLDTLDSLPAETQSLFKAPEGAPFILTTPSTIFHAQGGGQPSDTGTIKSSSSNTTFRVHQVRKVDPAILHMGVFEPVDARFAIGTPAEQNIDVASRLLNSRLHTAGHVIGLAASQLVTEGKLPADLVDGKASHYPGAAFVEFHGLIAGDKKAEIQDKVDELVARDLGVAIHFWSEERAREECLGAMESFKGGEEGVRVVSIGEGGQCSYPCGGTHVQSLRECGRVVLRNVKRQKGVSKVSYEVRDA
ncbi:hypothetical protein P153DRAFT_292532 [Dothidotthia symphoricarpi CBS 119687]|uniref:Threonyl/alanyl tRNA synthetase SAD domain-containing protein n=1 Tax=Dothidotthia symphoricarpi CBS 119687 TaxID=1392245 RepID=A0A6A6AAV2_9PLEO|nr:uncharacterized protein P153DRAFT_292532 [Dothidotthia symphoricarpi CBS 119687]KAF2128899.1 hypothetical protein P153DRAFT_292532 [Dothidotthia symphoricarpi CBS 119687]